MTAAQEAEWGRVFDAHDFRCAHTLSKKETSQCIWSCGRFLTEAQMKSVLDKYPDPMTKQHFLSAMRDHVDGEPKEKEILTSLQAFDVKETNELTRMDIMQMLTTMQDKLPAADVEQLLSTLQFTGDDRVSIDALFKHMTRLPRNIKPTIAEIKKVV